MARGGINLHRTISIHRDFGTQHGATRGIIRVGDGDRTTAITQRSWSWLMIAARWWPDRRAIVAWSLCYHGQITMQFGPRPLLIDEPRSSCDHGHQISVPTGSNGPELVRKSHFKNQCIHSLFLNFWSICEEIKRILRKVLSSSLSSAS